MPKHGNVRKKRRTHVPDDQDAKTKGVPKCFVLRRGNTIQAIKDLINDWRQLMSPYCALKLRESTSNKLKDFLSVSSVFGVTHIISFSQTDKSPYMRFIRVPEGPTLTFKIIQFSLSSDIRTNESNKFIPTSSSLLLKSPVIVMNGFRLEKKSSSESTTNNNNNNNNNNNENDNDDDNNETENEFPTKMLSTFIANMYPTINLDSLKTTDCSRVVLFHLSKSTNKLNIRQYGIVQRDANLSKGIMRIIRLKNDPDQSILDVNNEIDNLSIIQNNNDDLMTTISGKETSKVSLGLYEIGPRITAELVKIESAICTGKVLYHRYQKKTADEIAKLQSRESEIINKRRRETAAMEAVVQQEIERRNKKAKKLKGNLEEKKNSKKISVAKSNECELNKIENEDKK